MQKARLRRLLHQYFNNSINAADCMELLDYLNSSAPAELNQLIDEELSVQNEGPEFKGTQSQDVLNRILSDPRFAGPGQDNASKRTGVIGFYKRLWFQVAATVLIFCTAGLIIFRSRESNPSIKPAVNIRQAVIVPGGNKATLTIAGGKTIILDSAANGLIAQTGAGTVLKTGSGQIIYQGLSSGSAQARTDIGYNTLSTPRGGEYQVVLPDGTKVWLDAASSISYPVVFAGNERRVKLTGQAYFEVAKNRAKPFYVDMSGVQVKVLGTHFNISAYDDDNKITTTLLEGSVQITKNNSMSLLKPGQQAVINDSSDRIAVSEANIEDVMAWKNGYFIFDDDNISGIMRKVSRWYDVSVEYRGNYDDQQFGGTFYRSKGITELLNHLEKISKLHFKVSGRRVTVMD
ncbi:MAG TPA: FecR domain-containing protein [Mucilaginibacter sp.]|nr:FecR domain-containing protein [Mucilaginibacter sp.]